MVLYEIWMKLPPSVQRGLLRANRKYEHLKYRVCRYDRRTGFFSAGLPMGILTACTVAAATIIIDRQFELRYLRKQTLSQRQIELEEQHRQFLEFIAQTDSEEELDNSVPLPGRPSVQADTAKS